MPACACLRVHTLIVRSSLTSESSHGSCPWVVVVVVAACWLGQTFGKAMCWEQAIRVCAKLRQRFETQTYDYTMLGKFLLHHEAELFSQIVAGQSATHQRRLFPNYFFVTFHGPDFPQVCVSFCFGIVFGVLRCRSRRADLECVRVGDVCCAAAHVV